VRTLSRLNDVYSKAKEIEFDNHSKYVFVADVHRGDNSSSDEFGPNKNIYYHALQYYYQDDFTYVEVGDGDELWETKNIQYVYTSHSAVFNLLQKFQEDNRLIMLYGNHNMQMKNPAYAEKYMTSAYDSFLGDDIDILPGVEFVEAIKLVHRETRQEIFVCHGHQGDLGNDQLWWLSYGLVRHVWRYLHKLGIKYMASPTHNKYKQHKTEKSHHKWLRQNSAMLICGHTHRPRLPNSYDDRYFNTGCCIHPRGITCLEMSYGEIALVSWSVSSRRDGMVYIKRELLKGPMTVEEFNKSNNGGTHGNQGNSQTSETGQL
jgi:UDP-2,3-diacylglucosamine pyrophosphatase LpxH